MINQLIYPFLSGVTGVPVYPETLPQEPQYPCVIYRIDIDSTEYDFDGYAGLQPISLQVDYLANQHNSSVDGRDAVWEALKSWAGVHKVFVEQRYQQFEAEIKVFRSTLTATLHIREE